MTTLREAAQQALELCDRINDEREIWGQHELRAVCERLRAALAEPDEFIEDETIYCPTCGEEDGGTTCGMPDCGLRCGAEPVQEPVAWHYTNNAGASVMHWGPSNRLDADMRAAKDYPHVHKVTPLYTAPPQRPPLAEPEQEPVAWLFTNLQSGDYDFCYQEDEHDHDREMWHKQPLYTAPPQRKPLTEGN